MKRIFFIVLLFLNWTSQAQDCPNYPVPPKQGSLKAYIPKGWQLRDSAGSDFNNDKIRDLALVLVADNEEEELGDCNRTLVILQGLNASTYKLAGYSRDAVLCKRCGGVFGDPYESISFKKNVLNINHYGGSAWRWTKNFTFRFQKNQWELIGLSESTYWTLGECEDAGASGYGLDEVNFSTAKMHFVRTRSDACTPFRDEWKKFIKKKSITLANFDAGLDYRPLKPSGE